MGKGIEFGKGNKKYKQEIDKAMSLIRTWVNPDELNYREETGCLSFVTKGNHLYIFNICDINISSDMLSVYTSSGSVVFIHSTGRVNLTVA